MDVNPTLQAFLRVLYTVNSNPQYILAKSSSQVPIIPCGETIQPATNEPIYARTLLKACLTAVCDSSPELLQDPTRDFSVYVLDPLEAQPPPSSLAHTTNSPRGVAVALGLMSSALDSSDSTNVFVTGTIVPQASLALEVVFAFRETKRMPEPMLYSYPSFGPTHVPQLPNSYPPQPVGTSWSSTPYLGHDHQEQKTLTRSADFPEPYIGPPRRARGRPEGSSSSKQRIRSQDNTSSLSGASTSKVVDARSESRQATEKKAKQKTKSRPQRAPSNSPFIRAPLTRHATTGGPAAGATAISAFNQQSYPSGHDRIQSQAPPAPQAQSRHHPPHNPLLGLLSLFPSTSGSTAADTTPEQQAALLSLLQGLLATSPHLVQFAATNAGLSTGSTERETVAEPTRGESTDDEHADGDSDIVILDSSTIDTTAFRRPSSRGIAADDHDATIQEPGIPSSQETESSLLPASTPPSCQENTPVSSRTLTPTIVSETKIPISKYVSEALMEKDPSHILDIPTTPTPCRTRKRKLDEYVQVQASSTPISPPSPPSGTIISGSVRLRTGRQRVQPSPTGGSKSSPLARLPSILGSMRAAAASSYRKQDNTSDSIHGNPTTKNSGSQSTTTSLASSRGNHHPAIADASTNNTTSDTTSLKRRRTLTEFMAECEARQSTKLRKRSSGRRKEGDVPTTGSQVAPLRSVRIASTSRHAQSSPPRPLFRSTSATTSLSTSTFRSGPGLGEAAPNPASSSTAILACAIPSAPTSTAVPTTNPLKNFVLPAWARTSTATLPRLSDEVLARQRAEQEAKKAQVALKRREAARAKRRRLHGAEHPSKESSDEDDEVFANNAKRRIMYPPSSVAQSTPSLPPALPSLPVFASYAVEAIASSPPQSRRQLTLPNVPSTPPRKTDSSGSGSHRSPNKSGSCPLFTPSGEDLGPLFTPSTPSVTRSFFRSTFTPRSPTVLHRSGARISPRKSLPQPPSTPKRYSESHQTPKSSRHGRTSQYLSPGMATRTPRTGTRAFLLPPASPCASRTLGPQVHSTVPAKSTPIFPEQAGIATQESPPGKAKKKDCKEDMHGGDKPLVEDTSILADERSPDRGGGEDIQPDANSGGESSRAEEEYTSSPLPPSSPPPISPLSSPAKQHYSSSPTINSLSVPDSDILLPSVANSDEVGADTPWLSDAACTAAWFSESEASAWFTETEAWLTDTEGGPLPTDSDGAWLSDSDAVFGDISSFPPSAAPNWLSDDAEVDTDGEAGAIVEDQNNGFDPVTFEQAFAALVEHGGQNFNNDEGGNDPTHGGGAGMLDAELWASLQPLLGGNGLESVIAAPEDDSVGEKLRELLDDLVDAECAVDTTSSRSLDPP